jgi:hypothetical protein
LHEKLSYLIISWTDKVTILSCCPFSWLLLDYKQE